MAAISKLKKVATEDSQVHSRRIAWIDIAKGMGIILVIFGHTLSGGFIRGSIYSFHMPLFFILAGYTTRPKERAVVLGSSIRRLLVPYIILTLAWCLPGLLQSPTVAVAMSLPAFVLRIIFASGAYIERFGIDAVGTTWFLMALFVSRLIFNEILLRTQGAKSPVMMQAGVVALCTLAGMGIGSWLNCPLPFDIDIALVAVFFMWCGYRARQLNVEHFFSSLKCFIAAAIVWVLCVLMGQFEFAVRLYTMFPFALGGGLAGTYLCCQIAYQLHEIVGENAAGSSNRIVAPFLMRVLQIGDHVLTWCGKESMGIYSVHCIDWFVPWSGLAFFGGLPLGTYFASILRMLFDALCFYVFKHA